VHRGASPEGGRAFAASPSSPTVSPGPASNPCAVIGRATLYNADCRNVLPHLSGIDVMLTDPPYGIALANHARGKERSDTDWAIANDGDQTIGTWALEWAAERGLPTFAFASPMKPWPGKWRQHLVWEKGEHVGGGGDPGLCWKPNWELLQVARNGQLAGRRDGAVLRFMADKDLYRWHPTPKPTDLLTYIITKAAPQGATLLDPFMGSGSTGVACAKTGRAFIGCEIDPAHFATACKRIEDAQRQGDFFVEAA
jgi:site-specific DNA-methyltransferase (adenine-specific)